MIHHSTPHDPHDCDTNQSPRLGKLLAKWIPPEPVEVKRHPLLSPPEPRHTKSKSLFTDDLSIGVKQLL
ncbi:MAG: hypothetical protein CBE00_06240 [Planctomycetaceae bacterium TMED240]|nr:MAG: hypothetical protein CBE00_06240 [Planctomycetaceae bacterium TMED240]